MPVLNRTAVALSRPSIYQLAQELEDGWVLGTSPRMTGWAFGFRYSVNQKTLALRRGEIDDLDAAVLGVERVLRIFELSLA